METSIWMTPVHVAALHNCINLNRRNYKHGVTAVFNVEELKDEGEFVIAKYDGATGRFLGFVKESEDFSFCG